jgi:hypothetical protein
LQYEVGTILTSNLSHSLSKIFWSCFLCERWRLRFKLLVVNRVKFLLYNVDGKLNLVRCWKHVYQPTNMTIIKVVQLAIIKVQVTLWKQYHCSSICWGIFYCWWNSLLILWILNFWNALVDPIKQLLWLEVDFF